MVHLPHSVFGFASLSLLFSKSTYNVRVKKIVCLISKTGYEMKCCRSCIKLNFDRYTFAIGCRACMRVYNNVRITIVLVLGNTIFFLLSPFFQVG